MSGFLCWQSERSCHERCLYRHSSADMTRVSGNGVQREYLGFEFISLKQPRSLLGGRFWG